MRHRIAVRVVAARPIRRACLLHPPSREKMKPEAHRNRKSHRRRRRRRRTCRVARHRRKSTSCPNQCQRRVRQPYSCLCSCVSSQRMCVVICRPRSKRSAPQRRTSSATRAFALNIDESRPIDSSITPPPPTPVSTVAEEASIVLLTFGHSDSWNHMYKQYKRHVSNRSFSMVHSKRF